MRGFSLIELMVVIAIVSLLAAVAVPSYKDYVNKTYVVNAMPTLNYLDQLAQLQFEQGSTASSLQVGGVSLASNTPTALSASPLIQGLYIQPGGAPNVPSTAYLVCVFVSGLSYSGYVAPTSGNSGTGARLCMQSAYNSSSGVFTKRCGQLDGSSPDVLVKYLPSGCNTVTVW